MSKHPLFEKLRVWSWMLNKQIDLHESRYVDSFHHESKSTLYSAHAQWKLRREEAISMQNANILKWQYLRNYKSDRLQIIFVDQPEIHNCTSRVLQYYPQETQHGCRPPTWKLDITSKIYCALTDFDQVLNADAKCHARDDEKVKIETGSSPIWRTFVFTNQKL